MPKEFTTKMILPIKMGCTGLPVRYMGEDVGKIVSVVFVGDGYSDITLRIDDESVIKSIEDSSLCADGSISILRGDDD